jgi:EAL domain-containing protein (putative c-di-GMP-specific phosphodiesterase class I)
MAAELHMVTTAEGVENDTQRELLEELGCDQIQGGLIALALPGEGIPALLNGPMPKQTENMRVLNSSL